MTDQGQPIVFHDAFRLIGTHGVPLELMLMYFAEQLPERNIVSNWERFVVDAKKDGWKPRTIRARCLAAVGDVYGPKYRDEWLKRFDLLLLKLEAAESEVI